MNEAHTFIYGKHAVREALTARPDSVRVVYREKSDEALETLIRASRIEVRDLNLNKLPKGVPADAVHQGVIAEVDLNCLVHDYDDFIKTCSISNDTAFVLLGEVQDPHNVGAVIRSSAAFGVSGILIPEHRQAQVNGTVVKVSAGMAFRVPLISIGNVNQTIADLKKRGFWVYGLEGESRHSVADESYEKPSVFVLGNEATGIREKTLEHCDILLRIPMHTQTESLNASASASVVLYTWSTKHPRALTRGS